MSVEDTSRVLHSILWLSAPLQQSTYVPRGLFVRSFARDGRREGGREGRKREEEEEGAFLWPRESY